MKSWLTQANIVYVRNKNVTLPESLYDRISFSVYDDFFVYIEYSI